jgi:hypothetical protein
MPRYEVRLEAQDGTGHFRVTRLDAADKDDAKRQCERMELKRVLFELTDDQKHELLERYEVDVKATGPEGVLTSADLEKGIGELPIPAALDASADDKAEFRALAVEDRARLHTHFQSEPYEVVSVEKVG